ncbi:DUF1871 family protein [Chengkuizengella sediminis]|uniref:DUF1871 family protein n=1 Tax=Chengkuizengella sediminis TaxID=1885917 RepID=UPI0013893D9B|nr:DUF1871 family protein [Chengkuizengella sediminis]NDI37224.1 DUF1871 family protein [Chengkuizengella sediminis]
MNTKTKLTKVINDWDPANLFPGAPDDEYEREILSIMEILDSVNTPTNLAKELQHIFNKAFSWNSSEVHFTIIANKIWSEIK